MYIKENYRIYIENLKFIEDTYNIRLISYLYKNFLVTIYMKNLL